MKSSKVRVASGVLFMLSGCSAPAPSPDGEALASVAQAVAFAPSHGPSGCADHPDGDEHDGAEQRATAAASVTWRSHRRSGRGGTVSAKILGFNDFHGQLGEGRLVGGRPVGGAAVLATYLKTAASGFEGRSLIIHAGDHVGASPPESALLQDEPSIQFLNTLTNRECDGPTRHERECNVIGTLGNHEFDEGQEELFRLIYGGNHAAGPFLQSPYRGANFPYVNANVVKGARKPRNILPPYVIRKLGRVKVGVIGAVLKETPTIVTAAGVAGLTFRDEASSINEQVAELKRRKVDTIIVSIHQGAFQSPSYTGSTDPAAVVGAPISTIVSQLDDAVDLVISGHAHAFTNALVKNASGHEILVTQAFSASTAYADIELELDVDSGDVLTKSAKVVTTFSDVAPGTLRDPAVQAIVDQARALTAPLVNRVVATFDQDITRAQTTAGESRLGNLIADAQRAATGTDFAFMNPGGIRDDLRFARNPANAVDADGTALWGELFTVQPFANILVTMSMSGQQVYDLLNQQFAVNRFLQISGLEYTWDNALPAASRVVEIRQGGAAIDRSASYTVTANNFIVGGGDGFTVFTGATNQVTGPIDLEAFVGYLERLAQPFSAPELGRVTRLD